MEISDNRVAHFRIFTKKKQKQNKNVFRLWKSIIFVMGIPNFCGWNKKKTLKNPYIILQLFKPNWPKGPSISRALCYCFCSLIHPERIFSPRVQIKIKRRYSRKLIQIWNRFFSEKRFLITPTHEYKNSAQNNIRRHSIVSHLLILSRKISYAMSKCVFLCYFLIT